MRKFDRWATRHYTMLNRVITLLWVALAIVLVRLLDWPLLLALLLYFVGSTVCSVLLVCCGNRLFQEAFRQVNQQCDPELFLREMEASLTYSLPPMRMLINEINYALALMYSGNYTQAYERLNTINISHPRISVNIRTVYYANRLDLCFLMGKYQEVEDLYEKMARAFDNMKPGKAKEMIRHAVEGNTALYHFCRGEYAQALQLREQAQPKDLCSRVCDALCCARLYAAMHERDKAMEQLQFVLEHGNKLNYVTEARALLAEIDMEESHL